MRLRHGLTAAFVVVCAVGGAAAPAAAHTAAGPGAPAIAEELLWACRLASYLGVTLLVGGWIFLALVWPAGASVARTRGVLWAAGALALVGTVGGLAASAALIRRDLASAFDAGAWQLLAPTASGRAGLARALLLLLAVPVLVALRRDGESTVRAAWWRVAATAVGIGLLRTPGFAAHATEQDGAALGSVADLVHLIGVAAWLGGLVLLAVAVLPRRQAAELAQVVPRFSTLAMTAIGATVVAGTVLSWQLVGGVSALWSTEYGRVLLVKLALFAGVLVAARLSQRWVASRLAVAVEHGPTGGAVRPFVLSVSAEVVLAIGVVAVASLLVGTHPGA